VIKRAPRPDHGFLIIRNDVVRDRRLSYLARGLLASILSRPDNWTISAERLAAETDADEGTKTVRRALTELESAGYLERRRVRGERGRFVWEQIIYDTPRTVSKPAPGAVSAGRTISPSPPEGHPPDGEGPSIEVPTKKYREEDVTDLGCPDSGRFAPSVGAHESGDHDDVADASDAVDTETFNDWRQQDRELFRSLLGDALISEGTPWTKGKFTTDAFYVAFRKRQKRIRWPGRFLASIADSGGENSLDDWLIDQGLERVG
jgi:hypothetical protein